MPVSIQCPSCQATHSVSDRLAGRRVRCPDCDLLISVPEPIVIDGPAEVERKSKGAEAHIRRTVHLEPPTEDAGDKTVMLELVDVVAAEHALPAMAATPPAPPMPPPPHIAEDEEGEQLPVQKSRLSDTEMDMTPMVDVTFQLLIFFMITAAFALQKAKELPKPDSQDPSTTVVVQDDDAADHVTVKIDEHGTFTVISADGDEEEAPSIQDLYVKLRRAKTGGSSGKVPTKLRIESHGDALHERVVAALDAGNETGFAELELTSDPDEVE